MGSFPREVPFSCSLDALTQSGTLLVEAVSEHDFTGSAEQTFVIDQIPPSLLPSFEMLADGQVLSQSGSAYYSS